MKKKLIEYKVKLAGEYLSEFEKIEQYIECSDSMYDKKDECLEEILDLILTAQENGRLPEEVIGKDIETFCNNVMKGISYHSLGFHIAIRLVGISFTALITGMIFVILSNIFGYHGTAVVGNQINIIFIYGVATTTVLLDFLIDCYFRKQIAKSGKNKYIKYKGKIALILVILSSIFVGLIEENFTKRYTTSPRVLLVFIITVILAVVCDGIERRGGFGTLYGGTYNKSKNREFLKTGLYMKYEKKRAKYLRKNREFSVEYFSEKQINDIKIGHIGNCILLPFIIGEVFLCGYSILTKELGVSIFLMFIFILALLVINIKFMLITKPQLELLQEFCEERIDKENKIS